jgi:hypothetical protein
MDVDTPFASTPQPLSDSVLSALYSIQSQLSTISGPRASPPTLHPLQLVDFDASSDSLLSTLFQVRQAVSSFAPASSSITPKQVGLLREWTSNQASSLSDSHIKDLAQGCLANRKASFSVISDRVLEQGTPLEKTVALLEDVGKSVGLEVFKDEGPNGGVNLTMAGKVFVVDIEVEGTKGRAGKVRFAYGQETKGNAKLDRLLSDELDALDWESEGGPDERRLRRFREHLLALVRLDERMAKAESSADHFEDSKALAEVFEQVYEVESCVLPFSLSLFCILLAPDHLNSKRAKSPSEPLTKGHGLVLSYRLQPYLSLIYHVPAPHFLSDEWRNAESSSYGDLDALDDLVRSGVSVLRVETASASGHPKYVS